ncbi:unnamed protein product [Timema podura]|uniref:O-acyltransferase WSD1 C-terminal domain-containing protein n=1 Tax=Timema podura TaxID=61482 RepID=A0ABN7NF19_TIMPD|nr:unnamed protein product [Timema podura]
MDINTPKAMDQIVTLRASKPQGQALLSFRLSVANVRGVVHRCKDGVFMPHLNISSLNIRDLSQPMTSAANLGLATGFLLVVLLNSRFETIKREWRGEYQQWAEIVLARTVFVIACLLLFLAATPLVVLIFIVLMFYRQTVQVILWLVHGKRFAGLMEGADTVWALEDDTSKSVINILAMLQVSSADESLGEGLLTSLRQLVLSRVLTSPQRCPKLLYYRRKSALGYFYWERQNELHLENHIRWMETGMSISDGISEEILGGVISELANAPLPDQHASSWEILVGRNFISEPNTNVKTSLEEGMSGKYNKQKYPVLFRVHHSLGDGVALLQLLMKTLVDVCNENKNISATPLRKTVLTTVRAMESLSIPIQNKDDLVVDKLQNKVKRPDSPFEKYQNVKPVKHSFKAVTKDISSTMLNRDTINPTFPACKQHSKQLNYNSTGTKMSSIPHYLANPSNKMKVEESEISKEIKNKSIPSASLQFKYDVVYSKTNTKLPCYSASDSYITIIDDTKGAPVQTNNQNMKVYYKNPLSKSAIHSDCTNLEHTNKIQPNMQSLRHRKNSTKGEEKSKSASVTSKVLYHNGNIEPAVSTNMERSKDNTSKCSFSNQMQHLNKTNTGPPLDMEVLKLALIPKSEERNSLPIITCTSATPNSKISVTPMYTQRSSPIHIKQVPVVKSTNSPYFDSRTPRCLSPMSGFSSSSSSSSTSDSSNHRSLNSHHRSKSPMFDNRPPRCSSAMSGFVNPDFPSAIPDNSHHRSQSPMFDNRTPRCSSAMSGYITSDCSSAIPDSSNHRSQSPMFDKETSTVFISYVRFYYARFFSSHIKQEQSPKLFLSVTK